MTRLIEREWLSFAAALLILLGVAALSYSSAIAAEGTLASVEHTGHALERIESINADFARAVTARRAFIIAGDRSQLRDVPKLDATVRRSLAVVREHVSDDPSQRRDLDTLARAIDERLADLDASVERRERTGTGANDPGEIPLSTRVRSIRERMVAEENRRLAERSASTRQQLSVTRITVLAGVAVSIAILALAFHRMRREIERRKRSEVTLAEKEAFLDTIVESVPDMLTVKSAADLRIERVNRAGETLLDHKREDILGKRDPEILGHVEAEASEAHDRHALAACVAVETTEEVLQTHDGARWLHTRRVPILDETGRPRHLLRISEDVTERRKMLETLERAKLAAEAANEGLREARAAADAANQAKSEFLSSMSHEVRTPLNAILGFAQLLQRDKKEPLSNRHMDRVGRILTAGGHLLRLIDDILDLSRIEAGRVPLSIEPIALKDALSEVKTDLEEMATRFQIRVEVAPIPGELPRILADRTRLAQILVNFGSNAIKYNRPSGVVTFSATVPSADQIRVTVRDTGLGVSEAKQAQLFQPFQRAGHENGPIEGTGIGLVVTKRLAEAMRGGVGFRSVPGEGSEFWVDLPIHPAKESPAFA